MNKAVGALITLLLLLTAPKIYGAEESEQIDFDIYQKDSLMVVWVDLSPLLTSKRTTQLKDGIDIALEYQLTLLRPKRFWGSHREARVSGVLHLGYRVITDDYFVAQALSRPALDRSFLSLGDLHKFLTDSITIDLASLDSLDRNKRYFIEMAMTCVSLTSLNVTDESDTDESGKSPIRWLFREFLDFTNFGSQDYAFQSRLFSLAELSPRR